MHLRSLSLRQFRLYARLELDLPAGPLLLVGANAQGKTSLLEAIAMLALGHSPLVTSDQQVIAFSALKAGLPFACAEGEVVYRRRREHIAITVERKPLNNGTARLMKSIQLDHRPVRQSELAGHLNVVFITADNAGLVSGPPALRRRYLDDLLGQVQPDYGVALEGYRAALAQRNALLRYLRESRGDMAQLDPLEEALARHGVRISLARRAALRALSRLADRLYSELTGGEWLQVSYQPHFDPLRPPAAVYQPSLLEEAMVQPPLDEAGLVEAFRTALRQNRARELQAGTTLIGPHRDELRFVSQEVDLGLYGSRGQQRTAMLALRLAEMLWMEQTTGEKPVLLLDEALAELDRSRRTYLMAQLAHVEQAILATTDADAVPAAARQAMTIFEVQDGIIRF